MHAVRSGVVVLREFLDLVQDEAAFDDDPAPHVLDLVVVDLFFRERALDLFEFQGQQGCFAGSGVSISLLGIVGAGF
jgi:hypothetical protein